MSLQNQINSDFKEALKNKDTKRLSVLRMLKSSLQNKQIEIGEELNDEQISETVVKEVKQRKDSINQFTQGKREDLAKVEEGEIKILEKYMPKQLSEKELSQIIDKAIFKTGGGASQDMGKIMGMIMPQIKGKADGFLVSKLVKEKLEN